MKDDIKRQLVISALTTLAIGIVNEALRQINSLSQVNWLLMLLAFAGTFGFLQLYQVFKKLIVIFDEGRRRGLTFFTVACLALAVFALWDQVIGPSLSGYLVADGEVNLLIRGHRWITYDPQQFDPLLSPVPSPDSIDTELKWIRSAGFDGIITFTSRDTFSTIPKLARNDGLLIIMGVWDPTDQHEIALAISARDYVDAYSVGHNGLDNRYSYGELARAIQLIRFRTGRPVSTTEKIGRYLSDQRLLEIGDWIFPDAHVSVQQSDTVNGAVFIADAPRDALETIAIAKQIAAQMGRDGKPILLKMVTYPMDGITNASLRGQASFFIAILDGRRNVLPDMPSDVSISVHSAFDTPWKTTWPFYEWDPYAGLLDNTGTPRPAAQEIIQRLP